MLPILAHLTIVLLCLFHILMRRHRAPVSRLAWICVVLAVPYLGALAYLLLGSTNIGRSRVARLKAAFARLTRPDAAPGWDAPENAADLPELYEPLFRVGKSINGYPAIGGNRARLMENSEAAINQMVADIDAAEHHVHTLFYIWLDDHSGRKVAEALKRAVARGVTCRSMADALGSREMIRSETWALMKEAGVSLGVSLAIGNPLLRIFNGRIDLRNHRKIIVIDNHITYCGSQNCADAAFLPKAKFAPWVDAMMRFEGPITRENQHLFASDWMECMGEDLSDLLRAPLRPAAPGFTAQVIGTGPTARFSAMPEMFESLIYAARRELFITTPYYVPNGAIQAALCAAANRGVDTTVIFPARNDNFAVGAASRSNYEDLLEAGVKIFEFQPGLLHTKSLTMDGQITLIGSANMDRRSFDLNFENNILLSDPDMTAVMRARQADYQAQSHEIVMNEVDAWPIHKRIVNNTLAILDPIL
ncbi:MAG: cardiolipin synthase [Paracoccus sp. (in: a-proteobacteria)]